jgi:hypothetical protein
MTNLLSKYLCVNGRVTIDPQGSPASIPKYLNRENLSLMIVDPKLALPYCQFLSYTPLKRPLEVWRL